jgi:hypothetical protein
MTRHFVALAVLFVSFSAQAKVLFEGYYKLEVKGVHRGYMAIQHSLDEKKNERTFTYYQYKKIGKEITQSGVTTTSTADYKPLSYRSYEWDGKSSVYVEGKFGTKGLELTKYDGRTNKVLEVLPGKPVPPMAIFSALVSQVQARNVSDYKDGYSVAFNGLSEESAQFDHGEFKVLRSNPSGGQMIFQVLAIFMNEPFEFFTFRNGEVAGTRSQIQDQITYLVANREEAVKDFGLQEEPLKTLFKTVPFGVTNNPVGQSNGQLNVKDVMRAFPAPTAKEIQSK